MRVREADPRSPEGRALLEASQAHLAALYPPEDNFYLSVDELAAPHVTFLMAEDDAGPTGCAALARMGPYAEIKSMFVDPRRRGAGTGAALMAALEGLARNEAIPMLRLETGDDLFPAHRLYRRHGFVDCGPFGDYFEGLHSVFMEKALG